MSDTFYITPIINENLILPELTVTRAFLIAFHHAVATMNKFHKSRDYVFFSSLFSIIKFIYFSFALLFFTPNTISNTVCYCHFLCCCCCYYYLSNITFIIIIIIIIRMAVTLRSIISYGWI